MASPIEEYGIVGDTQTAALISRRGSIDWLCLPRFDSGACFAALLGDTSHGRWLLAPADPKATCTRRYRGDSLVLETTWTTGEGTVRVIDLMPIRERDPDLVRVVEGVEGQVRMSMELIVRFDYGSIVPWVRRSDAGLSMVAGPDALLLRTPVETRGEGLTTVADFVVNAGDRVPFVLLWHPSHEPAIEAKAPLEAIEHTETWWNEWVSTGALANDSHIPEHWRTAAVRSIVTLKALTYEPSGGIVAAATTSLPEEIGGERNWDYRACWLRDSTFTLYALTAAGYLDEAASWFDWLYRAVAGDPAKMQIMYGPAGERRLTEWEVGWLPGYEGSRPVRVGNHASTQFQLDVYGEVMDSFHEARRAGLTFDGPGWDLSVQLVDFVCAHWREPDNGIWEMRSPPRHFTHSKVMAWVALDRAIKAVEQFGRDGPVDHWREVRAEIHTDVCRRGFDAERNTFTQVYGGTGLDAALMMIPMVGFLEPADPRVLGTLDAICHELSDESGLVRRYDVDVSDDGLKGSEGRFVACSFWMVDNLALCGRVEQARELFERLLHLTNDLGLLAEEFDPAAGRMLGNFPQAFSHVALVNSVHNLASGFGPAAARAKS